MDFVASNWEFFLLGFMVAEKIVKITPTKYDDIAIDIIWGSIKKLVAGKVPKDT